MAAGRDTGDLFSDHIEVPETLGRLYRNGIEKHVSDASAVAIQLVADERALSDCQKQIDTILSVLDRIASCGFGCHGDDHLHQQLISKFCNHTNSVRLLATAGLNDQAYSCYRSMAEILNLMMLFWFSSNDLQEFCELDGKQRMRKFSPAQVRARLEEAGAISSISKEEYSRFSGVGVHPDVSFGANHHNPSGLNYAIPKHQALAFWDLNYRSGYMCSLMATISSDMKKIPPEASKLLQEASVCLSEEILPRLVEGRMNLSNDTKAI